MQLLNYSENSTGRRQRVLINANLVSIMCRDIQAYNNATYPKEVKIKGQTV